MLHVNFCMGKCERGLELEPEKSEREHEFGKRARKSMQQRVSHTREFAKLGKKLERETERLIDK